MRKLAARGISIIYISHRLVEIFDNCDRVSVFRDGQQHRDRRTWPTITPDYIVNNMVGRVIGKLYPPKQRAAERSPDALLEVRGLTDGRRFRDVAFALRKGEILGIAGLIGAGRSEIVKGICGLHEGTTGEVVLNGKPLADPLLPRQHRQGHRLPLRGPQGRRRLPRPLDRRQRLGARPRPGLDAVGHDRCRDRKPRRRAGSATGSASSAAAIHDPVSSLSGGNQQKVAIAKMLSVSPRVIFLDEPTRGVDVGAKAEIHRILRDLARERRRHRRRLVRAAGTDRPLRPRARRARGADQRRGRGRRADRGKHHAPRLVHRADGHAAAGPEALQ